MSRLNNQDEEKKKTCKLFKKKYSEHISCKEVPKVSDSEQGLKFEIKNKKGTKICVVKIDKGALKEKQHLKMCDCLMIACEDELAFFIEYKGQDLKRALTQIHDTLNRLSNDLIHLKQVNARIVLKKARVPNIKSTTYYKQLAKKLIQIAKTKGDNRKIEEILQYGKTPIEETIS